MLDIWTVYWSPKDYPGRFVARRFELDRATQDVLEASSLEELRGRLPPGLTRMARDPADDPVIVEVWL